MKGYGLLIVISVVILTLVIVVNTCTNWTYEGFLGSPLSGEPLKVDTTTGPKQVPSPLSLTDHSLKDVTGTSSVTDLPSAPVSALADVNSLPQTDPANEKATLPMINELKQDMDGFYKNEYPHIKDRSDPAINLPLTRFQGDYQRVKDEISVLKANPGIRSQISIQEIDDIGANLRYLQRAYRDLATVELVPPSDLPYSKVGEGFRGGKRPEGIQRNRTEGFADTPAVVAPDAPITVSQLQLLSTSIAAEIIRLQASGTNDPVITARVNIFSKIGQTVNDLLTRVKNGSMAESAIPIKVSDYQNFLPALGNSSAGIGGLLSSNGLGALSNLFNAYDAGDSTGSQVAATLLDTYMKDAAAGLSYSVNVSYTSPNDVAKQTALASYANAFNNSKLHPGASGSRGEFDSTIRKLDAFENGTGESGSLRPPTVTANSGTFDWKGRSQAITDNIGRAGMNPADYGCLEKGAAVSPGYSWRGYTKMICSRLATNADPAIPEQMGCPPVSWKGWRS